jgi:hypothetical protein
MREARQMTDKPDGKPWGWGRCAWGSVAMLVVYVVAAGPLFALAKRGMLPDIARAVLFVIYIPLMILSDAVPAVKAFMNWYVGLLNTQRGHSAA